MVTPVFIRIILQDLWVVFQYRIGYPEALAMDSKHYKFYIFSSNNDLILYYFPFFVQKLIFDKPEPGVRKIVLATNLAETSITINDVVFVVDCGKAKETSYDALNNTPCLLPTWISKASARQVIFSFIKEYD
jgi:hypothetical protein